MVKNDSRRSIRLDSDITVSFKAKKDQKHISTATALNISAVGLRLISRDPLQEGQELTIGMRLPNGEKVDFQIKVIWQTDEATIKGREYTSGVRILENGSPGAAQFVKYYASEFMSSYDKIVDKKED